MDYLPSNTARPDGVPRVIELQLDPTGITPYAAMLKDIPKTR